MRSLVGQPSRTPSFLSGGIPRDRRGRIAQKKGKGVSTLVGFDAMKGVLDDEDVSGDETPRNAAGGVLDLERERERVMLESLRFAFKLAVCNFC